VESYATRQKIIAVTKVCGVTVLVALILFAALGPAKWQFRTGLGWRMDHVVGYFGFTLMFCLVWPRPFIVGGILLASAALLEGLQAFTPDRHCDFEGGLYSAGGVLAAALIFDLASRTLMRIRLSFGAAAIHHIDPPANGAEFFPPITATRIVS
jgi:hypothetical protein